MTTLLDRTPHPPDHPPGPVHPVVRLPTRSPGAGAGVVARRRRHGHLGQHACGRGPVGLRRWRAGPDRLGLGPDQPRPADRAGVVGPAAHPGAADGPHPGGGARLRAGRTRPTAPPGGVLVLLADGGPHRRSSPSATRPRSSLNPFVQFWELVVDYPGMLLATAGTVALVMVVVTSIRKARRRLRYESWHLLHLYAYLGVGLALPHQLWTGQDFLSSPVATVYWWTLWAAAAGAILVFRIGLPVYRSARPRPAGRARRAGVGRRGVGHHARPAPRPPGPAARPVLQLAVPHRPRLDAGASRTRSRQRRTARGCASRSRTSATAAARSPTSKPGTRVLIEGPYGRLHPGVRTRRKVTLMASGIGISPMRALLEGLPQEPGDVTLLYRARGDEDLALRAEIEQIGRAKGARVVYVLGRRVARPRHLAPRVRRPPHRRGGPAATGPRHRRPRRLPLRRRRLDGRRRGAPRANAGCPPGTSTANASAGDPAATH